MSLWRGAYAFAALLALLLSLPAVVQALEDPADALPGPATAYENLKVASNDGVDLATFNGDPGRYVRAARGKPSFLNYTDSSKIQGVDIAFFANSESLTAGTWQITLVAGLPNGAWLNIGDVFSARTIGDELSRSSGPTVVGQTQESIGWSITRDAINGWHNGNITLKATDVVARTRGCQNKLSIVIRGQRSGVIDDIQIGNVLLTAATSEEAAQCEQAADCPPPSDGNCAAQQPAEAALTYWFNGARSVDSLYALDNVRVVDDLPKQLDSGVYGYARIDSSKKGTLIERYVTGGMVQMAVTIAVAPPDAQSDDGYVQVQPMLSQSCGSPTAKSSLSNQTGTTFGNWSIYDIVYTLGPVPQLACQLPQFAKLEFNMPPQYDIRIAAIRISGVGSPAEGTMTSIPTFVATPKSDDGILGNMLFVWIAAGIGSLIVFFLLLLVWYCCGRPMCCCGSDNKAQQPGNIRDQDGRSHLNNNGHVMIAVDTIYPSDMPPSIDDDRYGHEKLNGYHQNGMLSAKASRDLGRSMHSQQHQPVVDLSVPVHHQSQLRDEHMGLAPSAPRLGQDIFDTWQHTGLGYASGEEADASGPLDTQAPSFTANPPMSSTGNTSPTQESSVIGVTAQLGMRLNELRGLQNEHERVAKGGFDSNGEMSSAPEPLGVAYGKKIGVGGFGAVYEGQWSGRQVAVKVIKMPQTNKPGEEKAKMGFMEYAISGILLHDNIVQTYQADIRPVFLEDDGSGAAASKSGWTGIGEFLSNDAISQQLQKSMRIQEWELRLVMEYCNRGNLKEAIRNGNLQRDGTACALDVALLGLDVAKGCQAIHKYNIIHGDLKPHNVLLTAAPDDERGWIGKIADFGLSVKIKRGEQHVSGIQHGTEGYVAPEVLQTRRMVKASDVYSFGIIMWELWHARLYYEEHRNAVKRMRRPNLEFRPTFERHCPEEWVDLARLCWSLRPEERPDFDRVVKMMTMIVSSIREKVNARGVIPPPAPGDLNLL